MESLHEVFDALAGRPDRSASEMLHDAGYGDLPPELVGDALASYADTAPVEVAEHLAPFVTAQLGSPDATPDLDAGFGLLSSVPAADADLDAAELAADGNLADVAGNLADVGGNLADVAGDLDFGAGEHATGPFDVDAQAFTEAVETTAVQTAADEPAAVGEPAVVDLPEDFGAGVAEAPGAGVDDLDGLEPTDG